MNRIDQAMKELTTRGTKGLLPYLTAGLGGLETTERILQGLAEVGVTAVELGFPYSDPIADGPTIQSSFTRVLEKGIHVREILDMVARFRRNNQLPLLAMLSYSIVYRLGVDCFLQQAVDAGIDGLIIPDLSLEEAPQVARQVSEAGLVLPMLVSPASTPERRQKIAALSTGFVYYMSVTGITGERNQLPPELINNVRQLRQTTGRPVIVGFGISTAEHVRRVCSEADGAIIGSALVRRIMETQDAGGDTEAIVKAAAEAVSGWMVGLPA
ncbi:MAG: tryptophan synthase subunit alpha [Phycisphaerales bacterium]|nr:tryptophan synthase subunit alpha [Phycisphaerales bacterium]